MNTEKETSSQDRLEKFSEALEDARKMQQDWLTHGLDFVHLYVEDVDGDWLEKWGEDEEDEGDLETVASGRTIAGKSVRESVTAFLESDDSVAVRVRERVAGRSLPEIAADLVKCRSIPQEDDQRLFAVKTILADNMTAIGNTRASSNDNDEISLLDLAEDLLEKLAEIWDNGV